MTEYALVSIGGGRAGLTAARIAGRIDQVDRAVADARSDGFTSLVLGPRGRIVGATVVAPRAGETIAHPAAAVRHGWTPSQYAAAVHPYPTYADGSWNAALAEVYADLERPRTRRIIGAPLGSRSAPASVTILRSARTAVQARYLFGQRAYSSRLPPVHSVHLMVLRIVLGAVYTAMAVGQLASFGHMPGILAGYGLVNGVAATALAVALIAGELVCGVWFLARPRSKALPPVWVFTRRLGRVVAPGRTGVRTRAHGGQLRLLRDLPDQRLSWFVLVQDALTLFYAGLLLHGGRVPVTPARAWHRGQGQRAGRGARHP
ncbi:hypothetical protein [Streptomyces sp. 7N604]|uniref:hypothetical protein n=1 Tax=Streptomyces sp. 7N604 TaxID=3457415 RepID=UPI003FD45E00